MKNNLAIRFLSYSVFIAFLTLAITLAFPIAKPKPAECAGCSILTCYGPRTCGNQCVCIKRGMDLSGSCYSVNKSEPLPFGYSVME